MAAITEQGPYRSTYSLAYRPLTVLPPINFCQPPSFDLRHVKQLQPRQFPVIPEGPQRHLLKETPLGPGLGTKDLLPDKLLDTKPIVKSVPPRQLISRPPALLHLRRQKSARDSRKSPTSPTEEIPDELETDISELYHALCNRVNLTSTTRLAAEEGQIPMRKVMPPLSTFEENADLVKFRPQRYEPEAETWQTVANHWERAQTRPRIDSLPKEVNQDHAYKFVRRQRTRDVRLSTDREGVEETIVNLLRSGRLAPSYERPCPGYAGFRPRSPIEAKLERTNSDRGHLTVMKESYRKFPAEELRTREFAHKGPLSRTVTLTLPCNPFNKIERQY